MEKLFTAQTDNADSSTVVARGTELTVYAFGTFDTSTVKIQVSPDGGTTWIDKSDVSFTSADYQSLQLAAGVLIRGNLASVGGSSSVSLWLQGQGAD